MVAANEKQQDPVMTCVNEENTSYDCDHVLAKFTQKPVRKSAEKTKNEVLSESYLMDTIQIAASGSLLSNVNMTRPVHLHLNNGDNDEANKDLCTGSFVVSMEKNVTVGDCRKESEEKEMSSLVAEDCRVDLRHTGLCSKFGKDAEAVGVNGELVGAPIDETVHQLVKCSSDDTVMIETGSSIQSDETIEVVSLSGSEAQCGNDKYMDEVRGTSERNVTTASVVQEKTSEEKKMIDVSLSKEVTVPANDASVGAAVVKNTNFLLEESDPSSCSWQNGAEVKTNVGIVVAALVDNVVNDVKEKNVPLNTVSAEVLSNPNCVPHLSADEALELLMVHHEDVHDLLSERDKIVDVDMDAKLKSCEYQWFDGDDDEEIAMGAPYVLDVAFETTDDVFGINDLNNDTHTVKNIVDRNSDKSTDRLLVNGNKSSSCSSESFRSSSSSSSPSSCSSGSCSEDESVTFGLKKRRLLRANGRRKLLKHTKEKGVRSLESSNLSWRQFKHKRKIPNPVIPPEYAIFDVEAADPILKGSYSLHKNRRARFHGNWGFSAEAFHDIKNISPFEYTSHARVLHSRRNDDRRPISGKYTGFFKLRQSDGALVKVREDQVELQFMPMPTTSDEEDTDEDMKEYKREMISGYELAASRYIVLGKGKNCFGQFLVRGYLSLVSGRLTVKRRYLD